MAAIQIEPEMTIGSRTVKLTNLDKVFWEHPRITKRELLQYYADVAPVLLPHLNDRAMVMKRYPNGASGEFFFMKRTPSPRPEWLKTCSIEHASGNIIDFPIVDDLAALLWVVNLGCIDLNQWYATCDDVDRPDYLHFDLDPGARREVSASARDRAVPCGKSSRHLKMPSYPKTTGSRGIHIYVPIVRGPLQKQVWTFAKAFAKTHGDANFRSSSPLNTAIAKRPAGHVLVDYNQNAWGRTLASRLFRAAEAVCASVRARHVGRSRRRASVIRASPCAPCPSALLRSGICTSRCSLKTKRVKLEDFLS